MDIRELKLSPRTRNTLRNMGVTTIEQARALDDAALLREPSFGRKSLRELREAIASIPKEAVARRQDHRRMIAMCVMGECLVQAFKTPSETEERTCDRAAKWAVISANALLAQLDKNRG